MELETRRLLLRPLHQDDAPAMARALNNYEVAKYLSRVPFPYSLEDARFFIDHQRSFGPKSKVCAITFRAAPGELLGVISYELNTDGEGFEFGYWLNEACWNMRLMTEAAQAMVAHAFACNGVDVLTAGFWNPVSGRLLRNLGFAELNQTTIFSVAQNREIAAVKLQLSFEMWAAQQKAAQHDCAA